MTDKTAGDGDGATLCWCMRLPPQSLPARYKADLSPNACFCPACLQEALNDVGANQTD